MRFHLLGLAHIPTCRERAWCCGYTQKIINLATMLKSIGHTVIFYGGEYSEVPCDEFVVCVTAEQRRACYGDYDWKVEPYRCDGNDSAHLAFNARAISSIQARKDPHDFLLCTFGVWQEPIAKAHPDLMVVEPGVGYGGIFSNHCVFESYAWMHHVYGRQGIEDGRWFDAVIPNFFDVTAYEFQAEKEGYALYFGRITKRKGVDVAVQVTKHLHVPLMIAGQLGADRVHIDEPHVHFVGAVSDFQRSVLMRKASVLLVPTYYLEPFGGVAVEAMLCGTPVVTSDWGAFPETVNHGVTGFRCRTFAEFCDGVQAASCLEPIECRNWAVERYSLKAVAPQYQRYFERLETLWTDGWYAKPRSSGPSASSAP